MTIKVNHEDLPAQSFEDAHRGRVCVRVFIRVSVRLLRLCNYKKYFIRGRARQRRAYVSSFERNDDPTTT